MSRAERPRLPSHWPLVTLLPLFPVWWILGLGGFIWPLVAIPLAVHLVRRGASLRVPRSFGLWLLFLGWYLVSVLATPGGPGTFGPWYRFAMYVSSTVLFLYVYNQDPADLPQERVGRMLTSFWLVTVAGGFLGILLPRGSLSTITEDLMPRGMLSNDLVARLVHPVFADVQTFLDYGVARPVAPFLYSNYWGSVLALLAPFVGWVILRSESWRERLFLTGAAIAAVVPAVLSLNRGMFLTLAIGVFYAASRRRQGTGSSVAVLVVVILAAVAVIVFSPLGDIAADRVEEGHSNERRMLLYREAIGRTADSPLLGYGQPVELDESLVAPPVGTQGQLWLVMVSQGFVGLGLFLGWWLVVLWRTRSIGGALSGAVHVALLVYLLQLPMYDMLPYQANLIMIIAAAGLRAGEISAQGEGDAAGEASSVALAAAGG